MMPSALLISLDHKLCVFDIVIMQRVHVVSIAQAKMALAISEQCL